MSGITEAEIDRILNGMTPEELRIINAALKARRPATIQQLRSVQQRPGIDRDKIKGGLKGGQVTLKYIGELARITGKGGEWTGPVAKLLGFIDTELIK